MLALLGGTQSSATFVNFCVFTLKSSPPDVILGGAMTVSGTVKSKDGAEKEERGGDDEQLRNGERAGK